MHDYKVRSAVLKNKIGLLKIPVIDCGEDTGESHRPLLFFNCNGLNKQKYGFHY